MSAETIPAQPAGDATAGAGAAAEMTRLADDYLDDLTWRHPDTATELGDHRFDDRLPDRSPDALADERRDMDDFAGRLSALDLAALGPEQRVDVAMMADDVARRLFEIEELREHAWNPLLANPGQAVYALLARDYAPLPDRMLALALRLAAVPGSLRVARQSLGRMPKMHIQTAVSQFDGTIGLVTQEVDAALKQLGDGSAAVAAEVEKVRPAALDALAGHRDWLAARLEQTPEAEFADPRLGGALFSRKLSLTLSTTADAAAILDRAEADLERITREITEVAAELGGSPREVLDRLGADAPDGATILRFATGAFDALTAFVRGHDLVTTYDDPLEFIEMPEVHRGIAVAYCDSPGMLEPVPLPTFIAVSPTPQDWPADRVASFYREYNRHMVHDLIAHEGMPGHYLQMQHARRFSAGTPVRAALWSGAFVEGWAVYVEKLIVDHGYPAEGNPAAMRMMQLKMQLRMAINAILDARLHAHEMTEAEGMALMTGRGFQEEGEAAGKWRRAVLTSGQLSTYYVGYTEMSDLARDLAAGAGLARPDRAIHDAMLAHGAPPVRLLRGLLEPVLG